MTDETVLADPSGINPATITRRTIMTKIDSDTALDQQVSAADAAIAAGLEPAVWTDDDRTFVDHAMEIAREEGENDDDEEDGADASYIPDDIENNDIPREWRD
jgi:hypothetical protein